MQLTKQLLTILSVCITLALSAQDAQRLSITLKGSKDAPVSFDTIYLNKDFKTPFKVFTNVTQKDSVIQLNEVPAGKYVLLFASKNYHTYPLPVVVCGKCSNALTYHSYPTATGTSNTFSMIEVSAGYRGGDNAFANEFWKLISKSEKKMLKKSPLFTVDFFVTKDGAVSNVNFTAGNISDNIKSIIIKGLEQMKNWTPAMVNGVLTDDQIQLNRNNFIK